jgi:hypothetical protein
VRLGPGLKKCSCEFTSSAPDMDGGASPGVRFGLPQYLVGDRGCVALDEEKKPQTIKTATPMTSLKPYRKMAPNTAKSSRVMATSTWSFRP